MKYLGLPFGIVAGLLFGIFGMALASPNAPSIATGQAGTLLKTLLGPLANAFTSVFQAMYSFAGATITGNPALGIALWIFAYFFIVLFLYTISVLVVRPFILNNGRVILVPSERLIFGILLGFNASLNVIFWLYAGNANAFAVTPPSFSFYPVFAILSLFSLLAIAQPVSTNKIYQTFLGWIGWVMPTTWFATLPGIALWIGMLIPTYLGGGAYRMNFVTGTIETAVGLGRSIPSSFGTGGGSGIAFGHFAFIFNSPASSAVSPFSSPGVSAHECGHTLTFCALGGVFGWANLVFQIMFSPNSNLQASDYGELMAHSYTPIPGEDYIPFWSN